MEMDMEGHKMFEMDHSTILGLTLNSQLTYDLTKLTQEKFSKKFYGCSRLTKIDRRSLQKNS